MDIRLRKAEDTDSAVIISLMKKLADYENLNESCNISEKELIKLLNEEHGLNVIIAEKDSRPVGFMAYYFYKIATFSGKRVMYIEDVFIDEAFRRLGIGSMLFDEAHSIARANSCARLEWKCLDWNIDAQNFYKKIGGIPSSDEWITYTIDSSNF